MNDLLSTSFSLFRKQEQSPPHSSNQIVGDDIEMGAKGAGNNLDAFFADVAVIKDELAAMEALYTQLQISHEKSKTLYTARAVKDLRNKMDNDVNQSLIKAKFIKLRLEALDKSNVANRTISDSGPGSTTDRTRTSVVDGMRKKLRDDMNLFNELRQRISVEYRETVQRRYYTVTGENPDEAILDSLISSGESELFLQKAIQLQGRGQVMDTITEIQERHDAVREIEKNLRELHQVFVDMAVLVDSQGVEINDIETQVKRANSYVNSGVGQLQVARKHQKNTRKWTCFAIILLLVIVAIIVLSIRPWSK